MSELRRDLLLHPIRLRIVQALANQPLTPGQLQAVLTEIPQATLYRHITRLEDGGLIEVTSERKVRGTTERTFSIVDDAVSLGTPDLLNADRDEHLRYFSTFLGTLVADFAAYLDGGEPDLEADRVGYRQAPLWLSDAELDELLAELRQAIGARLRNEPDPGRRRRLITTVVMPDDRNPA